MGSSHPTIKANGKQIGEHRLRAEKALGKSLPQGAVVHHHTKNQLVICQNDPYHHYLHRRTRALKECGHANWRKCKYCKQYDSPDNLYIHPDDTYGYHRHCKAAFKRLKSAYRRNYTGVYKRDASGKFALSLAHVTGYSSKG